MSADEQPPRVTATPAAHPSENELLGLARGLVAEAHLPALEVHLDECEVCRRAVAAAASDETLAPERTAALVLSPGETVGRYIVQSLLGAGGMGLVYSARDPTLDRAVALKVLRGSDDEGATRMLREAQTMARLAHPNVVPLFELGEWRGEAFLAMELVDGTTLDEWLRAKPRSQREILVTFLEAAKGLSAAHDAGVVHRDFKPANVLVGRDGRVRVSDFGLARAAPGGAAGSTLSMQLTQAGGVLGTPAYMAPEQLDGAAADATSDQFSFCVALAEALSGRRPFSGSSPRELRDAMRRAPALEGIPARLRRVLARGLSVDGGGRYASMVALRGALDAANGGRGAAVWVTVAVPLVMVALWFGVTRLSGEVRPGLQLGLGAPVRLAASRGVERVTVEDVALARVSEGDDARLSGLAAGATALLVHARGSATSVPLIVSARVQHPSAEATLSLPVGVVKTLTVPGALIATLEPAALAEVAFIDDECKVTALEAGLGRLTVFTEGGKRFDYALQAAVGPGRAMERGVGRSLIALRPGEHRKQVVAGVQRVAVGDSAVCEAQRSADDTVTLIGGVPGTTSLSVWTSGGARHTFDVTVTGEDERTVVLAPGARRALKVPGLASFSIANREIIEVRPGDDDQLEFTAATAGETQVLVSKNDGSRVRYRVVVQPESEGNDFSLEVGGVRVVTVPELQRVAIADPEVIEVRPLGDSELLIIASAPGATTLLAWQADDTRLSFSITVRAAPSNR